MPATYRDANSPRKVAQSYIEKYHPHVRDISLYFLFTDKPIRVNGKERAAKTQKVSGLNAYLATRNEGVTASELVVIIVNEEVWKLFDDKRREAEIDRQLMHISVDQENGGIAMRNPDVEEFTEILERHGAYNEDLEEFIAAAQNPLLTGMEDVLESDKKSKKKGGGAVKHIPRERTIRPKKNAPEPQA
jgi:hypothetical protein